jgi:transposase-like protein
VTVNLKKKFAELEARHAHHIECLDLTVGEMATLRELDRQLVQLGLHEELQLAIVDAQRASAAEEPKAVIQDPPPKPKAPKSPSAPKARTQGSKQNGKKRARRIFTDLEKAEAVRHAEEVGIMPAAKEIDVVPSLIRSWRDKGFGKKPKNAPSGPALVHDASEPPAAAGPSVRCPSCSKGVPLNGPADDPTARLAAFSDHYKASPACEATNRRRSR